MITFVGPFPPPVHGQALATAKLREVLVGAGLQVLTIDTADGTGRFRKWMRLAAAPIRIALHRANVAYISVNSGRGIWLTVLFAAIARIVGKKIICHLHSSRYARQYDPGYALLARVAGADALHLANCEDMAADLKRQYEGIGHTRGYGNAGFVDPRLRALPGRAPRGDITLGHMSNLSLSKGLGRAIELLRLARREGVAVKLLVAGPCAEPDAERLLQNAEIEFQGDLIYLGPVHNEDKIAFFERIDIFVFPTRYVNEAGPIVNLEAMASAVPVISTAQSCIPSTLSGGGGLAISQSVDFASNALPFVQAFANEGELMAQAARRRFDTLLEEQKKIEAWLVEVLRIQTG